MFEQLQRLFGLDITGFWKHPQSTIIAIVSFVVAYLVGSGKIDAATGDTLKGNIGLLMSTGGVVFGILSALYKGNKTE